MSSVLSLDEHPIWIVGARLYRHAVEWIHAVAAPLALHQEPRQECVPSERPFDSAEFFRHRVSAASRACLVLAVQSLEIFRLSLESVVVAFHRFSCDHGVELDEVGRDAFGHGLKHSF